MVVKIEDFQLERLETFIPNYRAVILTPIANESVGLVSKFLITNHNNSKSYTIFKINRNKKSKYLMKGFTVNLKDDIIEADKYKIFSETNGKKSASKYANILNILYYYTLNGLKNNVVTPLVLTTKFRNKLYNSTEKQDITFFPTFFDMYKFFDVEYRIKYVESVNKGLPKYFTNLVNDVKYRTDVVLIKDSYYDSKCNGATRYSLQFLNTLKLLLNPSDVVSASWGEDTSNNFILTLTLTNSKRIVFTGLNAGYRGEGSRGSYEVLNYFGFNNAELVYKEQSMDMVR